MFHFSKKLPYRSLLRINTATSAFDMLRMFVQENSLDESVSSNMVPAFRNNMPLDFIERILNLGCMLEEQYIHLFVYDTSDVEQKTMYDSSFKKLW